MICKGASLNQHFSRYIYCVSFTARRIKMKILSHKYMHYIVWSKTKLESFKHCLLKIVGEKYTIGRKNLTKDSLQVPQ